MALFKYIVSSTPTNVTDFKGDVAKVLTGEYDPNELSKNCDKKSGFVEASTPLAEDRQFTLVKHDSEYTIVKRPHSKIPSRDLFVDIVTPTNKMIRLASLGNFDGGRVDPASNLTNTSLKFNQSCLSLVAGAVIYIGITETNVFVCAHNGSNTAMHGELFELSSDNGFFSYETAPKDTIFAMELCSPYYSSAVNLPRACGKTSTPVLHERPDYLMTVVQHLQYTFPLPSRPVTYMSNAFYPLPLPGGKQGLPLMPARPQPVNGHVCGSQYAMGGVYQAGVRAIGSMLGKTIRNKDVGNLLVLSVHSNSNGNSYQNLYIAGV